MNTLQIAFRTLEKVHWIELSWNADCARIVEIEPPRRYEGESTLSKQIKIGSRGMALIELRQEGFERVVELVMAFEEKFGIEIPDDAAETILTVKDAIDFIDNNK